MNIQQAVPFFRVADLPRALRFYVDGLGAQVTKSWTVEDELRWCWLELGATALMLQSYEEGSPAEKEAPGKRGLGVSITYQCADALALYHEFTGRGVSCSRPFVGNRMWFFTVSDPDGYVLEFESPTDAPEGATYIEGFHTPANAAG